MLRLSMVVVNHSSTAVLNYSSMGVLTQFNTIMLREHDHAHMVKVNSSLCLSTSMMLIKHRRA